MTELEQNIKGAFDIISILSVSGDAVDLIAAARSKLRKALELAKPAETEASADG